MEIAVTYVILCFVTAWIAGNRGRGTGNWFMIALLLSPLIGILCVLVAQDLSKLTEEEKAAVGKPTPQKKCPFCAEFIKEEAVLCRFCGKDLVTEENAQSMDEKA